MTESENIGGGIDNSADSDGTVLPPATASVLAHDGITLAKDRVGAVVETSGIDEIDAAAGSDGEDTASLPTGK